MLCIIFRQEKEGLLSEAVQSLKEALILDNNQQTAKENLEKLQQQLKHNEQVGHSLQIRVMLFVRLFKSILKLMNNSSSLNRIPVNCDL